MAVTLGSTTVLISNRNVHCDGTNAGFLKTDGNWDLYVNNGGNIWSSNYGWLHDFFMRTTSNCIANFIGANNAINCYGSGNIVTSRSFELIDAGYYIYNRNVQSLTNCNCACDCL